MNRCLPRGLFLSVVWMALGGLASALAGEPAEQRMPAGAMPTIGCWFWRPADFEAEGYRAFLQKTGRHAAFDLLTVSIRAPQWEVADPAVRERIRRAAAEARGLGMGLVMDLDVRLARAAFQKAYPDEQQEMLRLREVPLAERGSVELAIGSETLSDHYTARTTPYVPLGGRLLAVYRYRRGPEGIEPGTVEEVDPAGYTVQEASAKRVAVSIACDDATRGRHACVAVAFTHFTPDVFAPHLIEFQRDLIRGYADCGLAGACKDEWGFPPCFDGCPAKNDYWYSRSFAAAYAEAGGGADLVRDCLLMHVGERTREAARIAAINRYQELCWRRCGEIEDAFYRAVKETVGPSGVVATHPTWWPYPNANEFKKNGLHWWVATRDWAQTDEITPYAVRTSLAKRWGSPVWYNMYYSRNLPDYQAELWSAALAGGRVNYHPLYPASQPPPFGEDALLRGELMRGDCRVRLLNFISQAPLDCPVAVVFGHASAMNWAGPGYNDVGIDVADGCWRMGHPADLIPSDELLRTMRVDDDGYLCYGRQRYAAVVLYHPQYERPALAEVLRKAAAGKTALLAVGPWTADFEGRPVDGDALLPPQMVRMPDAASALRAVEERLRAAGIAPQSPATRRIGWNQHSAAPGLAGRCRLLDGTEVIVAGEGRAAGDPFETTLDVGGHPVELRAVGIAAVRLDAEGRLAALAAGGLRRVRCGDFVLDLETPVDLALWRDGAGAWQGVVQDCPGALPAPLAQLDADWRRLAVPAPLAGD